MIKFKIKTEENEMKWNDMFLYIAIFINQPKIYNRTMCDRNTYEMCVCDVYHSFLFSTFIYCAGISFYLFLLALVHYASLLLFLFNAQ